MSFNKRYININMLKDAFNEGGLDSIKRIFSKSDALFLNDTPSSKIYKLIIEGSDDKAIKLLKK